MLEEIVPVLKNFRDKIYRFFPSRQDAAKDAWSYRCPIFSIAIASGLILNISSDLEKKGC